MSNSDISFNEEPVTSSASNAKRESKLVQFVISNSGGLVKTKQQANKAMVLIIILSLISIAVVNMLSYEDDAKIVAPSGGEIEYSDDAPPRLR